MKNRLAAPMGWCIVVASVAVCVAQSPTASDAAPSFEVVSVKPTTGLVDGMRLNRTPGGGLSASNASLRMLISPAYDIRDHQLTAAPAWIDSERYDIEAKVSAEAAKVEPAG